MRRLPACLTLLAAAVLAAGLAQASDLSQTVQKANHLIILNELGITADQLAKLAPLSDRLVAAVQARNTERQRLLTEAAPNLEAARKALLEGAAPAPGAQKALDALEASLKANDGKLQTAAVPIMADIEKVFFPQQNRYVDWTPPGGSARPSPATAAQQAQREREATALLLATIQQLERIRMFPPDRYIIEFHKVVEDYLRPLIDPRSPEYPDAEAFMLKLVGQVRMMPNDEWEQRREEMAQLLVRQLGLLGPPEQATEPKPYNWQTMYSVFSDLGAPDLLREMQRARALTVNEDTREQ